METVIGAFKECIDPEHVDNGPLSPLEDFYASSPNICKACKRRDAKAAGERYRARRKEAGLPSFIGMRTVEKVEREIHARRGEETPEEEDRKLRELEATYQHGASPEQPSPTEGQDVFGFGLTEGFNSSYPVTSLFLRSGEMKKRLGWSTY